MNTNSIRLSDANRLASTGRIANRLGLVAAFAFMRTRLFELTVLLWSAPFGVAILFYLRFWGRPPLIRRLLRLWSTGFIHCARAIMGVRWSLSGMDSLPGEPVIFVANHQSYWESIAFTAFVPDLNVVSKREATKIPVFGFGIERSPMTLIDRDAQGRNIRRMVSEVRQSLRNGRSILIYPEGTRIAPGERGDFNRGVELLGRNCDAPIVPVVHNAGLFWPVGFGAKRPGVITVKFLPPIRRDALDHGAANALEDLLNREKDKLLVERRV